MKNPIKTTCSIQLITQTQSLTEYASNSIQPPKNQNNWCTFGIHKVVSGQCHPSKQPTRWHHYKLVKYNYLYPISLSVTQPHMQRSFWYRGYGKGSQRNPDWQEVWASGLTLSQNILYIFCPDLLLGYFAERKEMQDVHSCFTFHPAGTRMPWDPQYIIESLSDSTIYMSFYAVAHLLQGGVVDGSQPGPANIKYVPCHCLFVCVDLRTLSTFPVTASLVCVDLWTSGMFPVTASLVCVDLWTSGMLPVTASLVCVDLWTSGTFPVTASLVFWPTDIKYIPCQCLSCLCWPANIK